MCGGLLVWCCGLKEAPCTPSHIGERRAAFVRAVLHVSSTDAYFWSAETPHLYTLVITLKKKVSEKQDEDAVVVEVIRQRVGLRTTEVRRGRHLAK